MGPVLHFFKTLEVMIMKSRGSKYIPDSKHKGHSLRCQYCGSPTVLRSADGIYKSNPDNTQLYVCTRWPACDAYVRVHPGTTIPVGSVANKKLRQMRYQAHQAFDQLHKSGLMTDDQAYQWLAGLLQAPRSQAHIGYLGEYSCQLVIDESKKLMSNAKKTGITRWGIPQLVGGVR